MRIAVYARVSTQQQAQAQTLEQQLERLQGYSQEQGWGGQRKTFFAMMAIAVPVSNDLAWTGYAIKWRRLTSMWSS